jgi:tRNA pseudouridine55 synthase
MTPFGLLLINKPSGPTSHDIVNIARKKLNIRTIGHTGTLDPFATGLLILLVGKAATKQQSRFLKLDKQYLTTALFGLMSDTYDITGKIHKLIDLETSKLVPKGPRWGNLETILPKFTGTILQTVPPFSAVKRHGQKLYHLARKGRVDPDELPQRPVTIHKFVITNQSLPSNPWFTQISKKLKTKNYQLITFKIHCSSGTYIRSLIHDLGQELGTGALVAALHRTRIGPYSVSPAISPEQINTTQLRPLTFPSKTAKLDMNQESRIMNYE